MVEIWTPVELKNAKKHASRILFEGYKKFHFSKFGVKSQILNLFFFWLVACSQFKIFNKNFEFFVVSTFLNLVCLFTTKILFKRYQKKTLIIFFAYFLRLFNKKNLIIPWKKIWKEKIPQILFFIFKYTEQFTL